MEGERYQQLQKSFKEVESNLQSQLQSLKGKQVKKKQQFSDLHDILDQKNNLLLSKLQDLKRKETILLTLQKIDSELPQQFPKNYYCQLVYEDVVLTGNRKFTDFDENLVDDKFVLPLLMSTIAKVQIWAVEEEPILYDKAKINLEKDIENALLSNGFEGELTFEDNPELTMSYLMQLQGIGFTSWLKNLAELREIQIDRSIQREHNEARRHQIRKKAQQRTNIVNTNVNPTKEYQTDLIESILMQLKQ